VYASRLPSGDQEGRRFRLDSVIARALRPSQSATNTCLMVFTFFTIASRVWNAPGSRV